MVDKSSASISVLQCLNQSASGQLSALTNAVSSQEHPSLQVIMLTRMTEAIYNYSAYSYLVQCEYAQRNGYLLLPVIPDTDVLDYQFHRKLAPILDAMRTPKFEASDYFAWMDADLIPLDLAYRIEAIAATQPQAHILLSADVSSIANTGFMIIRNTLWARRFLAKWLAMHSDPGLATDQLGFQALYYQWDSKERREKIAIFPPEVMNSIAAPMGEQLPHHKILHLAAESTALRAAVFHTAAIEVCTAITKHRPVKSQLGITRRVLQELSQRVYGQSYRHLQHELLHELTAPPNEQNATQLLSVLTEYRTAVSKFCFATAFMNDRVETPETLRIRAGAHLLAHTVALLRVCDLFAVATVHLARDNANVTIEQSTLLRVVPSLCNESRKAVGQVQLQQEGSGFESAADSEFSTLLPGVQALQAAFSYEAMGTAAQLIQWHYASLQAPPSPSVQLVDVLHEGATMSTSEGSYVTTYRNLPELLKLSAELSYELLLMSRSSPMTTTGNDLAVQATLEWTLATMMWYTHPSQHSVIQDMQRDEQMLLSS